MALVHANLVPEILLASAGRLCRVDARLRELYPTTSNQDLATLYRVALKEINAWAAKLELRKDPGYRREVQRANARKRRLTAEQRAALEGWTPVGALS